MSQQIIHSVLAIETSSQMKTRVSIFDAIERLGLQVKSSFEPQTLTPLERLGRFSLGSPRNQIVHFEGAIKRYDLHQDTHPHLPHEDKGDYVDDNQLHQQEESELSKLRASR